MTKLFLKITGRMAADHFYDLQSVPRNFKTRKKRLLIQSLLFLPYFNSILQGLGWLHAYQHDYVIGNYVESAVIWRIHTASLN